MANIADLQIVTMSSGRRFHDSR